MASRYITHPRRPPRPEDFPDSKRAISEALSTTVNRVSQYTQTHPIQSTGVYTGLAGIALMEHRLSTVPRSILGPDLLPSSLAAAGDRTLLATPEAVALLGKGETVPPPSRSAFLETDIGAATLMLLRIIQSGSAAPFMVHWQGCVQLLGGAAVQAGVTAGVYVDGGCEVLYARAGLLYALLRIRAALARAAAAAADKEPTEKRVDGVDALAALVDDETVGAVVNAIVVIGREGARDYAAQIASENVGPVTASIPPLMWSWHGKRYLGAAHGVAGILHMLWNCPSNVLQPYTADLVGTLDWLVDRQDTTGNWPSQAPDPYTVADSELVEWCHGATGVVLCLSTALRRDPGTIRLPNSLRRSIVAALHEGSQLIYHHGFLRKGVGICHGVAGSVYALLAASRALEENTSTSVADATVPGQSVGYLREAVHLAELATEYEELTTRGEMRPPDHPWSLYAGAAGMCCAWADVLCRMNGIQAAGIPGFDDF